MTPIISKWLNLTFEIFTQKSRLAPPIMINKYLLVIYSAVGTLHCTQDIKIKFSSGRSQSSREETQEEGMTNFLKLGMGNQGKSGKVY